MSRRIRADSMPAGPWTPRITAYCPSGALVTGGTSSVWSAYAGTASDPRAQVIKHVRVMFIIDTFQKLPGPLARDGPAVASLVLAVLAFTERHRTMCCAATAFSR